jgi:hypothetical protein
MTTATIIFNNEARRVSCDGFVYDEFLNEIKNKFPVLRDANFVLQWIDDEEEMIRINTDEEFKEALQIMMEIDQPPFFFAKVKDDSPLALPVLDTVSGDIFNQPIEERLGGGFFLPKEEKVSRLKMRIEMLQTKLDHVKSKEEKPKRKEDEAGWELQKLFSKRDNRPEHLNPHRDEQHRANKIKKIQSHLEILNTKLQAHEMDYSSKEKMKNRPIHPLSKEERIARLTENLQMVNERILQMENGEVSRPKQYERLLFRKETLKAKLDAVNMGQKLPNFRRPGKGRKILSFFGKAGRHGQFRFKNQGLSEEKNG